MEKKTQERQEARTKLFIQLLGSRTSNNMTRLYCAMKHSEMLDDSDSREQRSKKNQPKGK